MSVSAHTWRTFQVWYLQWGRAGVPEANALFVRAHGDDGALPEAVARAFERPGVYRRVAELEAATPEDVFVRLNLAHPTGWPHRSLSVGDVLVDGATGQRLLCAAAGFRPLPPPTVPASPVQDPPR